MKTKEDVKKIIDFYLENIKDKDVYVIHCAAAVYIKTAYNPSVYDVNVNGTKNIIDKVLETKSKLI